MRIVFINRVYWPDEAATAQLLTDLAESLAGPDVQVCVITSGSGSQPGGARREHRNGVNIVRVGTTRRRAGGSILAQGWSYMSFLWRGACALWHETRSDSTIVTMTDPPLLGLVAWLVAKQRGARLIHWVQDIYPELAIELSGRQWLGVLKPLRNVSWRGAAGCVALGKDMAEVLRGSGVPSSRLFVIPNPAPAGLEPASPAAAEALRERWQLGGKFVLMYSGNLGRVHDVQPIAELADLLKDDCCIQVLIVGDGARRGELAREIARRGLTNVQFLPPQPREQLHLSLAVADLHLVTLRPGCEHYVFPSKLHGVLAIGRAVIFIGPRSSEVARLLTENGAGPAFSRDEVSQIAAAVRRLSATPAILHSLHDAAAKLARAFEPSRPAWFRVLQPRPEAKMEVASR